MVDWFVVLAVWQALHDIARLLRFRSAFTNRWGDLILKERTIAKRCWIIERGCQLLETQGTTMIHIKHREYLSCDNVCDVVHFQACFGMHDRAKVLSTTTQQW